MTTEATEFIQSKWYIRAGTVGEDNRKNISNRNCGSSRLVVVTRSITIQSLEVVDQ
jgi:hypothetical protein